MNKKIKKLTWLHSNDLHGDFYQELVNEQFTGGVSMLSGYITKERQKKTPCLFTISGDMFRGSVIDSEYRGFSTIDIMNAMDPDAVSIGNHELDYGLAQLLLLEKVANFPLITANMYIKGTEKQLFQPYVVLTAGGIKVLCIGVITDEIIAYAKKDEMIEQFVSVRDAAEEIVRVCNDYKKIDIDLTVILSHVGYENDLKLAAEIPKEAGVHMILGGHTHTILDQPTVVNDILIAQAGSGTDQIGRFDLEIDTLNNRIHNYKWQLIPINPTHCPRDESLDELLKTYTVEVDKKYNRVLTRLAKKHTHPSRFQESEAGNLFADCLRDAIGVDIMMLGAGSLRKEVISDIVTVRELKEFFPFTDQVFHVEMDGKTLKNIISRVFHQVFQKHSKEFYQWSKGIQITYDKTGDQILSILYDNRPLAEDEIYEIGLQGYHFHNAQSFWGIDMDQFPHRQIASSDQELMEAYLSGKHQLNAEVEGRVTLLYDSASSSSASI